MRIGIDARPLQTGHKYRGIGRYAHGRLKALKKIDSKNQYFLYIDKQLKGKDWISEEFDSGNFKVKNLPFSFPSFIEKLFLGVAASQILLPLETRKECLDIFYSFEYFVPFFIGTKFIITLYGLNPFSIDPAKRAKMEKQFRLDTAHYWVKSSLKKLRSLFLGKLVFSQIAKTSLVIASSQNSKSDIIAYFNLPSEKVSVISEGVELSLFKLKDKKEIESIKSKYRINHPYFLFVGVVEWLKNVQNLIKGYILAWKSFSSLHQLILAGISGRGFTIFQKMVKQADLEKEIFFTGYVPEQDLICLYSGAQGYILPSFYEGFPMTALEAMACGCPVLASNTSGIPEGIGNAGIYFDPEKPEEIAQAMIKIEKDAGLRQQLKQRGFARVRGFTWDKSTKKLIGLFEKVNKGKI